jgi:CRP/FNR family transcriptional regulator, dissimilatory nitrate respiration regulator
MSSTNPLPPPFAHSLDELPLFASLSVATRRQLIAASTQRRYAAGAMLFRAGSQATGLYVVLSGSVRVMRSRNGRQRVVHTEGPGGTMAEVPLFEGGTFAGTAEAVTPTRCLLIPARALLGIMREDPAVALLFLRRLATRVRGLVERLDQVAGQPVLQRLATWVLRAAEHGDARSFTLGMTQAQLAEELGTVREVVVRGLAQLRDEGAIVTAGRGRYRVKAWNVLRTIAGT